MPHSISPPQGMCVIASVYSIFLNGMTLERLQKDSLWKKKTLEQALANVSDIMHIIIPYSSSAINNFVGLFFPLSFLLSILLFSNKPLQFPKVYTYDNMTGETNISKFKNRYSSIQHLWSVSVQFSRSVLSKSLQPHGLQHARLPCPSSPPRACSNSCPSSW